MNELIESNCNGKNSAIKKIFSEREDFLIIGLTGRTGYGCSYVADFLKSGDETIDVCNNENLEYNELLKYKIISKYFNKHWYNFKVINMTDVILSFMLDLDENNIKKIVNYILNLPIVEIINEDFNYKILELYKKYINNHINDNKTSIKQIIDFYKNNNILPSHFDDIINEITEFKLDFKNECKKMQLKVFGIDTSAYSFFMQELGNLIRKNGLFIENLDIFTGNDMYDIAERAGSIIKIFRKIDKNGENDNDKRTFICIDAIRNQFEASYFQDRFSNFYLIAVLSKEEDRRDRLIKNGFNEKQIKMLDAIEYPNFVKLENIIFEFDAKFKDYFNNRKSNKTFKHDDDIIDKKYSDWFDYLDNYMKCKNDRFFYQQNLSASIQIADIYVSNYDKKNLKVESVYQLLMKYIMLILHPGIVTPSSVERCMQIANDAKLNSGCLSRQVGAVITDKNYSIKAIGWNTTPQGQVPCNLRNIENCLKNKSDKAFSKFELYDESFKLKLEKFYNDFKKIDLDGRTCMFCFKDIYEEVTGNKNQVHTRSLHAEENAFLQIVKYGGEGIEGGYLFTTASPCVLCSKKAMQLGIKKIYYVDPYTDIAMSHILSYNSNEINVPECILFNGAVGRAYTFLYSQKLPIKDELKALNSINN